MKISDASFTIFDVETTGLYPYSGDRICEIGAVRGTIGTNRMKRFHSLINPMRPISPGAFSVNGITEAMVRGAPLIEDIIPDFQWYGYTFLYHKITNRAITPKAIQHSYDKSYVVAYCHLKDAERNFRLDCILEMRWSDGREGRYLRG